MQDHNAGYRYGTYRRWLIVALLLGAPVPFCRGQSPTAVPSIEDLEKQLEEKKARSETKKSPFEKPGTPPRTEPARSAVDPEVKLRIALLKSEIAAAVKANDAGRALAAIDELRSLRPKGAQLDAATLLTEAKMSASVEDYSRAIKAVKTVVAVSAEGSAESTEALALYPLYTGEAEQLSKPLGVPARPGNLAIDEKIWQTLEHWDDYLRQPSATRVVKNKTTDTKTVYNQGKISDSTTTAVESQTLSALSAKCASYNSNNSYSYGSNGSGTTQGSTIGSGIICAGLPLESRLESRFQSLGVNSTSITTCTMSELAVHGAIFPLQSGKEETISYKLVCELSGQRSEQSYEIARRVGTRVEAATLYPRLTGVAWEILSNAKSIYSGATTNQVNTTSQDFFLVDLGYTLATIGALKKAPDGTFIAYVPAPGSSDSLPINGASVTNTIRDFSVTFSPR